MHVLVVGGAGFIGSHTVDRLVERGYRVRILDSLELPVHKPGKPAYLNPAAEFVRGDVTRPEDLLPALRGVDVVYNFAAYQDYLPDFSKFFRVNAAGTALIYELIVEHELPVRKVIVASSQAIYGEGRHRCPNDHVSYPSMRPEERLKAGRFEVVCPECGEDTGWQPTDESTVNPQNQYALSKQAQEQITIQIGRRWGVPSVGMRYSIVQGPRQSFYNAYSGACRVFCLSFHTGRPAPIYEDGNQVRDFVNIHDVVDANLLVLDSDEADYRVFNVGGDRAYTVNEFAATVADVFGESYDPRPSGLYRFGDTRHIVSDVSALAALGWRPTRTARDSVEEYVAWLREHAELEDVLSGAENRMRSSGVLREIDS